MWLCFLFVLSGLRFLVFFNYLVINEIKFLKDKDPSAVFLHPQTQQLLKSMTGIQLEKIYRKRTVSKNKVQYKFMTTEQIENEIKSSLKKANDLLQMPPIVRVGKKNNVYTTN